MTYSEKLKDPRWQRKRLEIMQRDGFACRDCKASHNSLNVHHCRYAKNPWEVEDLFLLTLCESCHHERQQFEDAAKNALAILFTTLDVRRVELMADQISALASRQVQYEVLLAGQSEFQSETRWVQFAREYPAMRPFVEAVLGRPIEWAEAS